MPNVGAQSRPVRVDESRAALVGIRKLESRHLRLYTDLPASEGIESLPAAFEDAIAEWAEYFGLSARRLTRWRVQGFVIGDREKFAALGLLPDARPDFENGYASGNQVWLVDQPSDYYRRHLLLHEGTHALMLAEFGGTGPGWYAEGMAELLGTHRHDDGKLHLGVMPTSREAAPMWGRIKLVREAQRAGKGLALDAVMALDGSRALSIDQYAWSWALCWLLDSHPHYRDKFRSLPKYVKDRDFNARFRKLFEAEWPALTAEWQAFVRDLDYGYDPDRMAMVHRRAEAILGTEKTTIAADRGWQSTGWLLKAGRTYDLTATGRYQIAQDESPWPCEPGGVTIEYHAGRPLGMLLGVLRSVADDRLSPTIALGIGGEIKPTADAVLYLKVNDSPARLSDNAGALEAAIRER